MYVWIYKNCVKIGAKLFHLTVMAIACSQAAVTLEYPRHFHQGELGQTTQITGYQLIPSQVPIT